VKCGGANEGKPHHHHDEEEKSSYWNIFKAQPRPLDNKQLLHMQKDQPSGVKVDYDLTDVNTSNWFKKQAPGKQRAMHTRYISGGGTGGNVGARNKYLRAYEGAK
jgi:hypothetical protein